MRLWTWIAAIVIFLGFFALYLATPTSSYTFDAVNYAGMIRLAETAGPRPLFHPHHLLYNAVGFEIWQFAQSRYPDIDPLATLQIMNAFAGAVGILVLFLVLVRLLDARPEVRELGGRSSFDTLRMANEGLGMADQGLRMADNQRGVADEGAGGTGSVAIAAVSAVAVGVTFGWWVASTDGRPYVPPLAGVFAAFYFAYRTARTGSMWTAAAFGACLGIAVLLHQSHGLFLLVGVAAVLLAPVDVRGKLRASAAGLATLFPIAGIPYALVLRLRDTQTISEAVDWTLLYAKLGVWWDFDFLGNLDKDFFALRHAFLADVSKDAAATPWTTAMISHGILIFASVLVAFILIDRYAGSYLRQRRHALRAAMETPVLEGAKGGAVEAVREPLDAVTVFNILAFVWLISYFAFFTVWTPGFFVFWISVAAAWVMVLVVNAAAGIGRSIVIPTAALAAVCFAITNSNLYILPKMPEEANPAIEISRQVRDNTPPDSLIIVAGMGYLATMEVYIPYFAERDLISLHQAMLRHRMNGMKWLEDRVRRRIADGKRVYVFGEAFDSPKAWEELNARYDLEKEDVLRVLKPFKPRVKFRVSDQPVYELQVTPAELPKVRVPSKRREPVPLKQLKMFDLRGIVVK